MKKKLPDFFCPSRTTSGTSGESINQAACLRLAFAQAVRLLPTRFYNPPHKSTWQSRMRGRGAGSIWNRFSLLCLLLGDYGFVPCLIRIHCVGLVHFPRWLMPIEIITSFEYGFLQYEGMPEHDSSLLDPYSPFHKVALC